MVSVIIPVYNEQDSIEKTVQEIRKVMSDNHYETEIIIVNDGSTDNTEKIAQESGSRVLTNPCNMGYGFSLKRGISVAKNETIIITDADLTYPFSAVPKMLEEKKKGFDLVVGARTGKYYRESFIKSILRKLLKLFVEYIAGKKIVDINSGLRIFDRSTIMKYFPKLCDTFSFTTSQTLAYMMDCKFVQYVEIDYNKRRGRTKVKILNDSFRTVRYITEMGIYYNPLKIFSLFSMICIILSMAGFFFSRLLDIRAGYLLGLGGLLIALLMMGIGMLAVLLKQIMDK